MIRSVKLSIHHSKWSWATYYLIMRGEDDKTGAKSPTVFKVRCNFYFNILLSFTLSLYACEFKRRALCVSISFYKCRFFKLSLFFSTRLYYYIPSLICHGSTCRKIMVLICAPPVYTFTTTAVAAYTYNIVPAG